MGNSFRTEELPEFSSCPILIIGSCQKNSRKNAHPDVFGPNAREGAVKNGIPEPIVADT